MDAKNKENNFSKKVASTLEQTVLMDWLQSVSKNLINSKVFESVQDCSER